MKYQVEEQVINATIQYLATKPYAETFQLIQTLQQSQPVGDKNDLQKAIEAAKDEEAELAKKDAEKATR
jgi:hypothetical protein